MNRELSGASAVGSDEFLDGIHARRDDCRMGTAERSLTRNQRILVSGVIWLFVGPLVVGFFFMSFWFGLVLLGVAGWTTYDYIRKGGMADTVVDGMSVEGRAADGAIEHYGHEEKD